MNSNTIYFHCEDVGFSLENEDAIITWIKDIVTFHNKDVGELNYIFCSDKYILKMNQEHLDHDYFTDIITFDYCENKLISGDLFISLDRVFENAKTFNKPHLNELHRVIAHGLLHLLGFNDKHEEEEMEMRDKEDECLSFLKISKSKS